MVIVESDANVEGQRDQHERGVKQQKQAEIKERPIQCKENT